MGKPGKATYAPGAYATRHATERPIEATGHRRCVRYGRDIPAARTDAKGAVDPLPPTGALPASVVPISRNIAAATRASNLRWPSRHVIPRFTADTLASALCGVVGREAYVSRPSPGPAREKALPQGRRAGSVWRPTPRGVLTRDLGVTPKEHLTLGAHHTCPPWN